MASPSNVARRVRLLAVALGVLTLAAAPLGARAGSDYIPAPPPTVYEDATPSPQTMGYDALNNLFLAHPGWLNDRLIHYYKFRMYTPDTYPTKVPMTGAPSIPVAPMYLLTTTGDFTGTVAGQSPILRWHTADGEEYSDFVEVHWVPVSPSYTPNAWRSYGDVADNVSSSQIVASGIVANVPIVPTGSTLQDPIAGGTVAAPINPLMAWYRGVLVQTFVFETTSQAFADFYNPLTRDGTAANPGSGYDIPVVPFASGGAVSFIPIWHLNQYPMGVTPGVNHGGPWTGGARNIIALDRSEAGYSPLWQVMWVAKVPIDYEADRASHAAQLTEANGFRVAATPMYVNCPNVGPVGGGAVNARKASSFAPPTVSPGDAVQVAGALVMTGGKTVKAYVGDAEVGSTQTLMMGAYVFTIPADRLPDGTVTIVVKDDAGNVLQSETLTKASPAPVLLIGGLAVAAIAAVAVGAVLWRRRARRRGGPPKVS